MKKSQTYLYYDKNLVITLISDTPLKVDSLRVKEVKEGNYNKLIGKRLPKELINMSDFTTKDPSELKVALICNWNSQCGISTYTTYLAQSMVKKIKQLKIFSEVHDNNTLGFDVDYCWERGESLLPMINKVLEYQPDFVIVQHEYGLFPNAFYFMQMCQYFENLPYVICMHSIYQHLDKLVYSECAKNILVHTKNAKSMLKELGNTSNVYVIPHGCITVDDNSEIWNIFQNPYTIMQFGFGFEYKGVDRAIKAIHHLKTTDKKFENIFYFYLLSENSHNKNSNYQYYNKLMELIKELGVENNVAIIKKFQTEKMLHYYLRMAKLCIFPYVNNLDNTVFGASGAIRLALANKKPIIASESHLFDDFEGLLPRPSNEFELAKEIDEMFSNDEYKNKIIENGQKYIYENTWDNVCNKYLSLYNEIIKSSV